MTSKRFSGRPLQCSSWGTKGRSCRSECKYPVEVEDGPGKRVKTPRVLKQAQAKLVQNVFDRLRKDMGRRLPDKQAVAKENEGEGEREEKGEEEEEDPVVEALAPGRWVNPSMLLVMLLVDRLCQWYVVAVEGAAIRRG